MTRAPDVNCRLCGWYGWSEHHALWRHLLGLHCVRPTIQRWTDRWLKRRPHQQPEQQATVTPSPPPREREWISILVAMDQVRNDDPGPVDLPAGGTPDGFSAGSEPSLSELRWRRASMTSFREAVNRTVDWECRREWEPVEPIDYEALRRTGHCFEQLQMYPGGGGGFHGYETVNVRIRRRVEAPAATAPDAERSAESA